MFKGAVYLHRWTYKGKRRKAWGIRYWIDNGPLVRKIVADTKAGAEDELEVVREKYRKGLAGVADGKTFADFGEAILGVQGAARPVHGADPGPGPQLDASLRRQGPEPDRRRGH